MTPAERLKWLNDDGDDGLYDIALKKPDRDGLIRRFKERHAIVKELIDNESSKNDI